MIMAFFEQTLFKSLFIEKKDCEIFNYNYLFR
jgi:hypothetical protein